MSEPPTIGPTTGDPAPGNADQIAYWNGRAGAAWTDLVDVTVYLTDMKKDFETYNRIYAEYFKSNRPCRTTLGITSLPTPISIELKCIATIGDKTAEVKR